MSYDLYFWRQERDFGDDPSETSDLLCDDQRVDGIAEFSRDFVHQKFKEFFPDMEIGGVDLSWEGDDSYFDVSFNHADERHVNCIAVQCGYQLLESPDTMNKIVDVGASLGCAMYDPQTGERYAQPDGQQGSSPPPTGTVT